MLPVPLGGHMAPGPAARQFAVGGREGVGDRCSNHVEGPLLVITVIV
jgi:hypothetical protein